MERRGYVLLGVSVRELLKYKELLEQEEKEVIAVRGKKPLATQHHSRFPALDLASNIIIQEMLLAANSFQEPTVKVLVYLNPDEALLNAALKPYPKDNQEKGD